MLRVCYVCAVIYCPIEERMWPALNEGVSKTRCFNNCRDEFPHINQVMWGNSTNRCGEHRFLRRLIQLSEVKSEVKMGVYGEVKRYAQSECGSLLPASLASY